MLKGIDSEGFNATRSTKAGLQADLVFPISPRARDVCNKGKTGKGWIITMTSRALESWKWQLIGKSQWCCSANCGHALYKLTYNWTRGMQLANTPLLRSTTPGLHPVSIHQMAPPVRGSKRPITAYY